LKKEGLFMIILQNKNQQISVYKKI
jgi:hypothetical protein